MTMIVTPTASAKLTATPQVSAANCRAGDVELEALDGRTVAGTACGDRAKVVTMTRDGFDLAQLPRPGTYVDITEASSEGTDTRTHVRVSNDGVVSVDTTPTASSTAEATVASPGKACGSTATAVDWSTRRSSNRTWYARTSVLPSNVSASTFVDAARAAATTIQHGIAPCDGYRLDEVSVRMTYGGQTNSAPCRQDGRDVVATAYISGFAKTCNYGPGDESDIALKVSAPWFQYLTESCNGRYDLQGVLTHEFGHAVGLMGVTGSNAASLTMSEDTTATCSYWQRSLGAGDVRGLRNLY